MKTIRVGVDIARSLFHCNGVNRFGKKLVAKQILPRTLAQHIEQESSQR